MPSAPDDATQHETGRPRRMEPKPACRESGQMGLAARQSFAPCSLNRSLAKGRGNPVPPGTRLPHVPRSSRSGTRGRPPAPDLVGAGSTRPLRRPYPGATCECAAPDLRPRTQRGTRQAGSPCAPRALPPRASRAPLPSAQAHGREKGSARRTKPLPCSPPNACARKSALGHDLCPGALPFRTALRRVRGARPPARRQRTGASAHGAFAPTSRDRTRSAPRRG